VTISSVRPHIALAGPSRESSISTWEKEPRALKGLSQVLNNFIRYIHYDTQTIKIEIRWWITTTRELYE
jgi:hypothetical protein